MPCRSDANDEADAALVANAFGLTTVRVDLNASYEALLDSASAALAALPPEMRNTMRGTSGEAVERTVSGNIRARLRMATLYYVANSLEYVVVGTGNRSELTIGYFTKHGDGGVDLLPIGHLLKNEVRNVARELGVPQEIIDKAPSAGLWPGQTDEAEMGFSYADLERYLTNGPEGVSPALALRLERVIRSTEHKRTLPPTPES